MTSKTTSALDFYEVGDIERRLGTLSQGSAVPSAVDLQSWRKAAAVLVRFDPATLKPVQGTLDDARGLDLLPELVPATGPDGKGQWRLPAKARKVELQRLASQKNIAAALAANPDHPDDPVQQMFDAVIAGHALPQLADLTRDQLSALLVVIDWLEGVALTPELPEINGVRAALESRQDLDRLRRLAGDFFTGRSEELAKLHAFLHSQDPTMLFIAGTGGSGKSALLAQALLLHTAQTGDPTCWVRIDIADATVNPAVPVTLLTQAAQQLSRRDTTLERVESMFTGRAESRSRSLDLGGLESISSTPQQGIEWAIGHMAAILSRYRAQGKSQNIFAFCVDSFEEAQFLGEPVAGPVLEMLAQLVAVTGIRVVICGRMAPPGNFVFTAQSNTNASVRLEILPLADLNPDDATTLLERFIRQEAPERKIETDKLREVANVLGGNPLTLKLAAHLIKIEEFDAIKDRQALQALKSEAAQARLYSRILAHIDDRQVQLLAVPGLVVRIITADVIRDVLAGPCGLGEVDANRAKALLEDLAREVTLVERVSDGVLRHRADIRRVMLSGMPDEMQERIENIHRRAVDFWHKREGSQSRAEELYHMLCLGAQRRELDDRWSPDMAPALQAGLQGVLEELPPGSVCRVWLAERLGVTLTDSERGTIAIEAQEFQVERAATQFLAHGNPGQALTALEKQKPFQPGSRLFALQSRVLFRLGRLDDALALTRDGIVSARSAGREPELTDLLLLQAYILERQEHEVEALEALARADTDGMPPLARLRMKVRRARMLRKLNQEDVTIRSEIIDLAAELEHELRQHPALLREVAAEVGDANVKLLGHALELFGPEILESKTDEQLLELLVEIGAYSQPELASFAGASHGSLVQLVGTHLDQLIHGSDPRSKKATKRFVDLLEQSVNDALRQNYEGRSNRAASEPSSSNFTQSPGGAASGGSAALSGDRRKKLIAVLGDVSRDVLRKVSHFNLDIDLERLGANFSMPNLVERLVDTADSNGLLPRLVDGVMANVSPEAAGKIKDVFQWPSLAVPVAFVPKPQKGISMSQPPSVANIPEMMNHYRRIAAARTDGRRGMGLESVATLENVAERTESTRESLLRITKDYLNNDPRAIEIANKVVDEGGEALRMLAADDAEALGRRPELFTGLEAIVRTDGSRPSFLVRNGDVDRNSSILGSWGNLLDRSAERLRTAISCVGRIDIPGSNSGFMGTGFLIQDNLILTNRHVLQVSARLFNGVWKFADGAAIDFAHEFRGQDSLNRRKLKRVVFCGDKTIDFDVIDHSKLDLALIELEPAASPPPAVLPLNLLSDWATPGTTVVTIGYPGSPPGLLYPPTLLEQLFHSTYGYKRLAPGEAISSDMNVQPWTLTHDATTLGGNSGSIVLVADSEQLAAGLHYGGRGIEPRENWGHVLASVLDATDGTSAKTLREVLQANGVRFVDGSTEDASTVKATGVSRPAAPDRRGSVIRPPAVSPKTAISRPAARPRRDARRDWRHGITLEMMQPLGAVAGKSRLEAFLEAPGDGLTDADEFADREGYDRDFLADFSIPLPMPTGDMRQLRRGGIGVELKYEHFSVIMSASRRMPMITGCNIDGAQSRRLPRIQKWSYDGRLNQDDQWGNELYADNDLDRGHMVRREDPVWGSLATARQANVDTFHYTNSCPQMAGVNQHIWLGLEDYVLQHTREDDMRVSVFTGPYFSPSDLQYRDALIPKAFWKIVAFLLPDGRPSATAYRVSQTRELQELEFVFAAYRTFQISIQQVMDATNIDFSELLAFDGFSQHERVHGGILAERLETLDQIRV